MDGMRTAIVTGGSRGIGRATVECLTDRGFRVAFTYKNSEELATELSARTGAVAIRADSGTEADVIRAVRVAEECLGGSIDCLVNNAAVSSFSLFTDITTEEWNRIMTVNLTGTFLYTRAVIPGMIHKKSGRIINVSSMWGMVGAACEVHYATSKAALIGMTKSLAKELGPSGITVNAVCPGVIDTDMNASLDDMTRSELMDSAALCRMGEPGEVARAIAFLASDEASFITGEIMNVSGGFVM